MVTPAPATTADGALVTVVIVNHNGAHLLPACLKALDGQDLPAGRMQVWVVDNASRDGSVELLRHDFPWVRVLANRRNDGFAGGNNLALRQVQTPFVALLNNDARPEPTWLSALLAPFQRADGARIGATTSKLVFAPRFLPMQLATPAFVPGGLDGRSLGVRAYRLLADGRDLTEQVLWDRLAYGPEGQGAGRFRWTHPAGAMLVPVDADGIGTGPAGPVRLELLVAAERPKPVELRWPGGSVTVQAGAEPAWVEVAIPAGADLVDVLNNAGGIVFADGYGADRAYQEPDWGQFDRPEDVFTFCGAAVCFRTQALRDAGFFDDDFFLYYEDTDLAWRLQALGWRIRYIPDAVVRHIHAATSKEWSPLFTFHVDRNRLLMLTKNARAGLAARELLRYPLTTASLALRALAQARHTRSRPPIRPTLLRLRVLGSYLRLAPAMLARRRALGCRAEVDRRRLARWLVPR